jgi:hypothetical protein
MSKVLVGQWNLASQMLGGFKSNLHNAIQSTLAEEAVDLVGVIKKGIRDQAPGGETFAPLSELTLASRAFEGKGNRDKILMVDGDLLGSVTHKTGYEEAWVGVLKSKVSSDGKSMVNIAAVHENGFEPIVIPYTDKVRKYLMAMMTAYGIEPTASEGGKKDVIIISIKPRPFLEPSFKKWSRNAADRWKRGIGRRMVGFGS